MRAPNDAHAAYRHINGRLFDVVFHNVLSNDFTLSWYLYQKNPLTCLKFENKSISFVVLRNSRQKVKNLRKSYIAVLLHVNGPPQKRPTLKGPCISKQGFVSNFSSCLLFFDKRIICVTQNANG